MLRYFTGLPWSWSRIGPGWLESRALTWISVLFWTTIDDSPYEKPILAGSLCRGEAPVIFTRFTAHLGNRISADAAIQRSRKKMSWVVPHPSAGLSFESAFAVTSGPRTGDFYEPGLHAFPQRSRDDGDNRRAAAVVDLGPDHLSGLVAWLVWTAVHITLLIGFENRLLVLLQWAWWYFTWERGARLITRPWAAPHASDARATAFPTVRRGA